VSFDDEPRTKPVLFVHRYSFQVKCPHCGDFHTHGTAYNRLQDGLSYAGHRQADCFKGGYVVERHDDLPDGERLKKLLAAFFSENTGRYPVRDIVEYYNDNDVDEVVLI